VEFDLYEQAKEQYEHEGIERPPNQTVVAKKRTERNYARCARAYYLVQRLGRTVAGLAGNVVTDGEQF
jgi:hypothetical protein